MKAYQWQSIVLRNFLGLSALILVYYVSDRYYLHIRTGFHQLSPYVFLVMLYGWIVFHNRVLFERLFLGGRKKTYIGWALLLMAIFTFNFAVILIYVYDAADVLPKILGFWVYTFAGLGIFAMFTYMKRRPSIERRVSPSSEMLECSIDGIVVKIPFIDILYLESYENYVKIITDRKTHLTRLPMKQAEDKLPKDLFVRISRSHIVNIEFVTSINADSLITHGTTLKIGKVYKRYVEEKLSSMPL